MDDFIFWMEKVIDPVGEARNDYEIFSDLANRLGAGQTFTEGRTADEWIEQMYATFHANNSEYPDLDELKQASYFQIPEQWIEAVTSPLVAFRADPQTAPLTYAVRKDRALLGVDRSNGLPRLPGPPDLDGAHGVGQQTPANTPYR